jgi:hypothetical protein
MTQKPHKPAGGKRPGAGRKPLGEKTVLIQKRVRASWAAKVRKAMDDKIEELSNQTVELMISTDAGKSYKAVEAVKPATPEDISAFANTALLAIKRTTMKLAETAYIRDSSKKLMGVYHRGYGELRVARMGQEDRWWAFTMDDEVLELKP